MKALTTLYLRARWLNVPGALLIALLQRAPAARVAVFAEELVASSPLGQVLRSAAMLAGSLGALHSMAGATTLTTNSHDSPLNVTAGSAIPTVAFSVKGTDSPPASWTIGGSIPAGLSFSGRTTPGVVNVAPGVLTLTGTPTTAGTYTVTLRAWEGTNATLIGSPTYNYVINVAAGVIVAPTITTQPISQTVNAGATVTFTAAASGTPTPTLQWSKNGVDIPGATSATLTLGQVIASDAGTYMLTAKNSGGTATSNAVTLTVNPATTPAPVFSTQPASQTIATGSTVVFTTAASDATSFQWRLNNAPISGATSAMLVLAGANAAAGSYTCAATGPGGTTVSNAATLTVNAVAAPSVGHLVNVSILTTAGAGAKVLTVGATIGGSGTSGALPLVVRAVGPTLTSVFGVGGTLPDPVLTVNSSASGSVIATNDNWGGGPNMANAFASVGAFALPAASLDSAFVSLGGLAAGGYTVQVTSKDGASSGTVLAEIYDAGDAARTATTPRLTNLSTLTSIDTGASLAAGFVLRGATSRTLLVRGIGPSLAALGVGGTMGDPKLELFNNDTGTKIGENDNWGGDAQLTAAMASVGAFPLSGAATNDAVILVTLPPGAYSARVSAAAGTGGTAIVEVYEVP